MKQQVELSNVRRQLIELNWRYELILTEPAFGILSILRGKIARGIRIIESAIAAARRDGWRVAEDWAKLFLCEVYLEVMFPKEKPSLSFLLKNIPILIKISFVGRSSIEFLVSQIRSNPQFDLNGHHIGRAEMILGLLYKGKRKRALAVQHLTEAKRILSQFGQTPILARVDAALAEWGRVFTRTSSRLVTSIASWTSKTKGPGKVESARSSATVLATIGMPSSASTLRLSR